MDKTCCMIGCSNTNNSVPDVQLFPFPTDFDSCKSWVENCKDSQLLEEFTHRGVEPLLNRHVCSQHFEAFDFIDPELKRLKPDAVPFAGRYFIKTESDEYTQVTCAFVKSEVVDEDDDYFYSTDDTCCVDPLKITSPDEKRILLKQKDAARYKLKISSETAEQREARLLKNRINSAEWRRRKKDLQSRIDITKNNEERALAISENSKRKKKLETAEEREARLLKNRIKVAEWRKRKKDLPPKITVITQSNERRALTIQKKSEHKKQLETVEERETRLLKNRIKVAEWRRRQKDLQSENSERKTKVETAEEREARLLKNRIRAAEWRKNESDAQAEIRKRKAIIRRRLRKSRLTEEQRELARQKSAAQYALKKSLETAEQREARRLRDRIKSANKRKRDKYLQPKIETEEQRALRTQKNALQYTRRKSLETAEQREARLLKDRVRYYKKRKQNGVEIKTEKIDC